MTTHGITPVAAHHIREAAETIAQRCDYEAAAAALADAVLLTLGSDVPLRGIVDLLLQTAVAQRGVDLRECMGFEHAPPRCPAMRGGRDAG